MARPTDHHKKMEHHKKMHHAALKEAKHHAVEMASHAKHLAKSKPAPGYKGVANPIGKVALQRKK